LKLTETELAGVYLIELDARRDERGTFLRTFCRESFQELGLPADFTQHNLVSNDARATLRGLHYQAPPHAEVKVVQCVRGSIYDVVVDLRRDSPTFGQWQAVQLSAAEPRLLYVPENMAHGYMTLEPETQIAYLHSAAYAPPAERGIRWNDPTLAIDWPLGDPILSERDRNLPPFQPRDP
jgi:dTDP-4-dehydrorhamnose 3,5-epimerase